MKKLLGLLALTVAVSGIASADQDVLKSINELEKEKQMKLETKVSRKTTEQELDGEML